MICNSLIHPFVPIDLALLSSFACSQFPGRVMLPIPIIVLIVISGHACCPCGHSSSAFAQIRWQVMEWQSIRMCCIDSVSLHMEHLTLASYLGMSLHLLPIM